MVGLLVSGPALGRIPVHPGVGDALMSDLFAGSMGNPMSPDCTPWTAASAHPDPDCPRNGDDPLGTACTCEAE